MTHAEPPLHRLDRVLVVHRAQVGVRHLIADQPLHPFGHFDRDLGRHADELVLALLEPGEVVVYDDRAPKPVLGRIASASVPERSVHDVHRAGVHLDRDRLGVLVDGPGRAVTGTTRVAPFSSVKGSTVNLVATSSIPGTTRVAPWRSFSSVKGSRAVNLVATSGMCGRGIGKRPSS